MIKRKIYTTLRHHFATSKKALLISGARQTGKTYAIRKVGHEMFKHFVEVNFVEHPETVTAVATAHDSRELLLRLSAATGTTLVPGQTLIFFDEVQVCPEIVTAIKFLVDEGSYQYVLSGSLLGVELNDLRSVPVGYMDVLTMHPLDLEEFVLALGTAPDVVDYLHTCYEERHEVDASIHNSMMRIVKLYLVVGGMPAVVRQYLETNNLQRVLEEQRSILNMYERDIAQYDKNNKLYIREIFRLIPAELNAANKRFILKQLNENLKFNRYENSFVWLKDAGVALPTYNVDEPRVPLLLSKSRNLFKLFQNDVGLLAAQYSEGIQLRIINGDNNINFGAVFENLIAQELTAHGFDLYYYNSKKFGELDFVIEHRGHVLPIEVKSGKAYTRHRALTGVMSCGNYDLAEALVLTCDNMRTEGGVLYAPVYMVMFVQHDITAPEHYTVPLPVLR